MTLNPGISDAALLDLLLSNPTALTEAQLEAFTALAADPGVRAGTLPMLRGERDRALAIARALNLLPKVAEKKQRGRSLAFQDPYSEQRTKGTEFADNVLARRPAKPPRSGAGA